MREGHSSEILLVEDSSDDAEMTLRALGRGGVPGSLRIVRDGEEALEFLFATGRHKDRVGAPLPQLVLLDLRLPKVGGLDVLRQVKADERMRCVPVVVLTSSREQSDVAQAYRLGANSYVVKPVDFESYVRVVALVGAYWLDENEPPF